MGNNKNLAVAIDGHSSCGKSTFAKKIADKYGLLYIDSGAMYRAVTLYALRRNLLKNNELTHDGINDILKNVHIDFRWNQKNKNYETVLNGELVDSEIRGMEVARHVSNVSKNALVREKMVDLQREFREKNRIVMDGRDIGTVVFPDAQVKIFLTASAEIRAQRRYNELKEKGVDIKFEDVLDNIKSRDNIDENRDVSPLKKAEDAEILDNSELNVDEQMEWITNRFDSVLKK